jgi:pimeloyl-ACP methyl ester carboxylesterase
VKSRSAACTSERAAPDLRCRILRSPLRLLLVAATLLAGCATEVQPDEATPTTTSTTTSTVPPTTAVVPDGEPPGPPEEAPSVLPVDQELDWRGCEDVPEPSTGTGGTLECATLQVRVDPADAGSDWLGVEIARRPAASGAAEGVIVVNPGGPGGSGVDTVARSAGAVPRELRDRFDVVGMDTRGTGRSQQVSCVDDDAFLRFLDDVDPTPSEEAAVAAYQTLVEDFERACIERHGELLRYLGTRFVARDVEVLRAALDIEQLVWFGYSYGTLVGTVYAQEFPSRVRALVLDGPVVTEVDPAEAATISLDGVERTFGRFAESCDRRSDCPFAAYGGTLEAMTRVISRVLETPLDGYYAVGDFEAPAGRPGSWPFNEARIGYALFGSVYTESSWPALELALLAVLEEDWGGRLRHLGDVYLSRYADPPVGTAAEQNFWALRCADREEELEVSTIEERFELERTELGDPYAGRPDWLSTWRMPNVWCLSDVWPAPAEWLGAAIVDPQEAPPAIAFGATGDFATPIEYLEPLSDAVGGAHVVRVESNDHGNMGSNRCQQELTVAFVLDPTEPPARGEC